LVIPVCEFAVPVDGPRGDAEIPFPSDCCAGIGSITAPEGINDPSLLGGVPRCTHEDDLLDKLTAVNHVIMLDCGYMLHCLLLVLFAAMCPEVLCVMGPCRMTHAQKFLIGYMIRC
jgi:hypothetical protein